MLKLVGTDGTRLYSFDLAPGKHVVGRSPDCGCFVNNQTVSRKHAEIEVTADGAEAALVDLGSHNGTIVNGERIKARIILTLADTLVFGTTEFRIDEGQSSPTANAVPMHTMLMEQDPENSVYVNIDEALSPLPTKTSERPELLTTLFDMAKLLASSDDQPTVLQRAVELVSRVIPSQRLAVLFVSDDQSAVTVAASQPTDNASPGAFQLSRTIVREIMTNKKAILIGDPTEDPRFAEQKSIIMSQMKSALAVPLFDEGKVLGILYADTASPMHRYDNEHLRILATFGNMIAAKLLSYSLLSERQETEILASELRRAESIQRRLLRSEPPTVTGWSACAVLEPSRAVGGDLYEMKKLEDGSLAFLVADVSGKGMGAALLMSNLLAAFRILLQPGTFDLCRAVQLVSTQMLRFSDPEDFATLFIGVAKPDGALCYVNAGHNPPLLVRRDGTVEQLPAAGIMIGAIDGMEWPEQKTMMEIGDFIVVYSDGVTEAERDEELYGEDRITKLLVEQRKESPPTLVKTLMDDIGRFVGDAPQSDDITILAVRRSPDAS